MIRAVVASGHINDHDFNVFQQANSQRPLLPVPALRFFKYRAIKNASSVREVNEDAS